MKQVSSTEAVAFTGTLFSLLLFSLLTFGSFSVNKMADDFLKQLGISKVAADEKITTSLLEGSLDIDGAKNAKNILKANRRAVVAGLISYVKTYVNGLAFVKQYNAIKEKAKPEELVPKTPEQFRLENIAMTKKNIAEIEASLKKADAATKPIFEKILVDANKLLKEAENLKNPVYVRYEKGYVNTVKEYKELNGRHLADWERKYPPNHLVYIKMRLQEFMNETQDIDFDAELTTKNGFKVFVNREYERKSARWKMAFRAGKDVVESAREAVQKWIAEIEN
jgi:hypothetical protein